MDMDTLSIAIGLVIGLGLGLALGRYTRPAGDFAVRERAVAAEAATEHLEAQNRHLREQARRDQDVLRALEPVRLKLADVSQHVVRLESERAGQYAQLTEQLRAAALTDQQLRAQTQELVGALRTTSARGLWGEVELRRVLEVSGLTRHVDLVEQPAVASTVDREVRGRPDVVVHLPGGKSLAIDAKVPLSAFLEAGAAQADDASRDELLARHAKALRGHVDALAARAYHEGLAASPALTVLFLPSEALLVEALRADPALLEHSLARGVAPATPCSLLALLKTVAVIWQHSAVTEEAHDLLDLGKTLYKRLGLLGDHVAKVGSSLQSLVQRYNAMVGSLEGNLLSTARRFEAFDSSTLTATPVDSERATVRPLTAAELTATDPQPI